MGLLLVRILLALLPPLGPNPAALPLPPDPFEVGSVWAGKIENARVINQQFRLKVTAREGTAFKGTISYSTKDTFPVEGVAPVVPDGQVEFRSGRVGRFQQAFTGKWNGDRLQLRVAGTSSAGVSVDGRALLRRTNSKPDFEPRPRSDALEAQMRGISALAGPAVVSAAAARAAAVLPAVIKANPRKTPAEIDQWCRHTTLLMVAERALMSEADWEREREFRLRILALVFSGGGGDPNAGLSENDRYLKELRDKQIRDRALRESERRGQPPP